MRANFIISEVLHGLRRNATMTIAMIITTAITPNHSTITGPNTAPIPAVPCRCIRNRATSTTSAIDTT